MFEGKVNGMCLFASGDAGIAHMLVWSSHMKEGGKCMTKGLLLLLSLRFSVSHPFLCVHLPRANPYDLTRP